MNSVIVNRTLVFSAIVIASLSYAFANPPRTILWSTLDDPLGTLGTSLTGISGSNIVGEFERAENSITVFHGFVYDGTTFSTLDNPSAITTGSVRSFTNGIDGNNVVGWYGDSSGTHGFYYDGTGWTKLDDPLATDSTFANAISGTKIVGHYRLLNSGINHAYEYDTTTHQYISLVNPSFPTFGTTATGISGNKIVGYYNSALGAPPGSPSFLYDGVSWKGLNDPGATNDQTYAQGIDGNNIVGYFENASGYHGFLFDGTNWLTLDEPNAFQQAPKGTFATAISGNKIVGWYLDSGGGLHGFLATIVPEPSSITMASLAFIGMSFRWMKRNSR